MCRSNTVSSNKGSGPKDLNVSPLPLSYALSLLLNLEPLPVHVFTQDGHYYQKYEGSESDEWNVLKTDLSFREHILNKVREHGIALITDDSPVLYGGVKCNDGLYLVVGPIVISAVDQNFRKLYATKHHAINVALYFTKPNVLASFLLLIHSSLTEQKIGLVEFLDKYFLNESMLDNIEKKIGSILERQLESERPHNPDSFEKRIIEAITAGDTKALTIALQSPYANMRGILSHASALRSEQNLAIVDITIATRAAISAGLNVEQTYVLADAFILEVEDCKKIGDASALARACALCCTQYVHSYKQEIENSQDKSAVVVSACEYMQAHVCDKFNLDEIVDTFKVSKGYLSRIFKEQMGQTLSDYSRSIKINLAKKLLETSDKSLNEITQLLSFHSQSHFGRVFAQYEGISPAKYRQKVRKNKANVLIKI